MKNIIPVTIIIVVVVIALAYYLYAPTAQESKAKIEPSTKMMEETITDAQPDQAMMESSDRYVDYSPEIFDENVGMKRVLFFHASWCPTCKVANEEFESMSSQIPEDIIVYKTNYDTESALKSKYAITYQHTFVLVDADGNEVRKWNGGGIDELVANTK